MDTKRYKKQKELDVHVLPKFESLAVSLGLCDFGEDYKAIIRQHLYKAAIIRHPKGNRRYKDWIFKVVKNTVVHIHQIKCHSCHDTKLMTVYEECEKCYGDGCPACSGKGEVRVTRPCPDC